MELRTGNRTKRLVNSLCMIVVLFCVIYGVLSTPVSAVTIRGTIGNSIRPISVYMINAQTNQVVGDVKIAVDSGVFEYRGLPASDYAMVFRVQLDPQFPLDYVEAVVPSVVILGDVDFGYVELVFSNNYTVFSGIVDHYLGINNLENLDNSFGAVDRYEGLSRESFESDFSKNQNGGYSAPTPFGSGGMW